MTLRIVPVPESELAELCSISRSTFIDTYASKNEPKNVELHLLQELNDKKIRQDFDQQETEFFFAKDHNVVVGYTKLNIGDTQTESDMSNSLEIERIYVIRSMWGKGIGRKLIEHAISRGRSKNLEQVWLGVWTENPEAIAFYTHLGFEPHGTHIFTVGDDPQTDLIMTMPLSDLGRAPY